jgi:branched-chain amino acid transport system substrate-binding protein
MKALKKIPAAFMAAILAGSLSASLAFAAEDFVLGSIWDQAGIATEVGRSAYRGSQVAVELINAEGGVFGDTLKLYNIDAQSDPTLIVNAASRLINELQVPCVVGLEDESLASIATPIFQDAKTVLLVGTASTPTIPAIGDYIFLNAFGDNIQGKAEARFASKLGWKKVVLLRDNASVFSTDILKVFADEFKTYTKDPRAIAHDENYQTGDTNFVAQLTRLKSVMARNPVDGLVLAPPFPQDAPILARQMRDLNIKLPVLMADGGDDASVTAVGGDAVEGFMVSTHFAADGPLPEPAARFVNKYREMFREEPGAFECLGYDGVRTLIEAILSIGKEKWESMDLAARRTAVRDAMQNHVFVTTAMPKRYPDPATSPFPRAPAKPVVFKVFTKDGRAYMDTVTPEEL